MTREKTGLPNIEFTVASGNYDISRSTIDRIVLHTVVGSAQSAIAEFGVINKQLSAHYVLDLDGTIYHGLEEYYTAYHSGNYAFNQRSIGIEHADNGQPNNPRPDSLYTASAKLVADICKFYGFAPDSQHVIRHHDVPGASTSCPDSLDTDRIIREAGIILSPPTPSIAQLQQTIADQQATITRLQKEKDQVVIDCNTKITTLINNNNATVQALKDKVKSFANSL